MLYLTQDPRLLIDSHLHVQSDWEVKAGKYLGNFFDTSEEKDLVDLFDGKLFQKPAVSDLLYQL